MNKKQYWNLYGTYKYTAPSWSQLARKFADRIIEQCQYIPADCKWAEQVFENSYRPNKVMYRACRRYYRKFKKNIIKGLT